MEDWKGGIPKGKKPNKKRKFQYVFTKTKEQVIGKMMALKTEAPDGECSKSFSEIYVKWGHSVRHKIKESTIANYDMKVKKHLLSSFGNKLIDSITQDEIYAFIEKKL